MRPIGPAANAEGGVYFSDLRAGRIYRIVHATGTVSLFEDDSGDGGVRS